MNNKGKHKIKGGNWKWIRRESETAEKTSCLVGDQSWNDSYGAAIPSGGGKSGHIQFEHFWLLTSLQTLFERAAENDFCQSYQAIRRDQVCPRSKIYITNYQRTEKQTEK